MKPQLGRIVHYFSHLEPFVNSPAIITMAQDEYIDIFGSPVGKPKSETNVHLNVFGAVRDYREFDVPHGFRPGQWHWPSECIDNPCRRTE